MQVNCLPEDRMAITSRITQATASIMQLVTNNDYIYKIVEALLRVRLIDEQHVQFQERRPELGIWLQLRADS